MLTNNALPEFLSGSGPKGPDFSRGSRGVGHPKSDERRDRVQNAPERGNDGFERIYREVAKENRRAHDAARREPQGSEHSRDCDRGRSERVREPYEETRRVGESRNERPDETEASGGLVDRPVDDTGNPVDETPVQEVSQIIRESLKSVSHALNLDIVGDLKNLDIGGSTEGLTDQFAEIVHALKVIGEILADAVQRNQSIEIKGKVFSPDQMVQAESSIRVEVFKIELALTMLGVSQSVAGKIADKQNAAAGFGLVQATDPSSKAMPVLQLRQIMDGMVRTRGEEFKLLVRRIAAALEKIGGTQPEAAPVKASAARVVNPADLMPYGTTVMRALLKIDTAQVTIGQNIEAFERIEKMDVPRAWNTVMSRNLTEFMSQSDQDSLPIMDLLGKKGGWDAMASVLGTKTADTLFKHLEQSVMNQLIDKFSTVVKAGMSEMRLTLRPESLGEVHLKVEIHGDLVSAKIHVENQQVKQIVENNLQSLKNALEEHNLQAGQFDVNVNNGSSQHEPAARTAHNGSEPESGDPEAMAIETGTVAQPESGTETGRRFGTNTVEFFA